MNPRCTKTLTRGNRTCSKYATIEMNGTLLCTLHFNREVAARGGIREESNFSRAYDAWIERRREERANREPSIFQLYLQRIKLESEETARLFSENQEQNLKEEGVIHNDCGICLDSVVGNSLTQCNSCQGHFHTKPDARFSANYATFSRSV